MNEISEKIYENLEILPKKLYGWQSEHAIFAKVIEMVKPSVIIEVGTWVGASAIHMAKECKKRNLSTKIYCVDTWLGAEEFWTRFAHTEERSLCLKNGYPTIYYQFLSNVVHEGMQDVILPFPNTSTAGAKYFQFKNIKADLIYVDGSHLEEDVYSDMKNYYPILNDGGIIFGDDYTPYWDSVRRAVSRFCNDFSLKFFVEDEKWWIVKNV